MFYRNTLKLVSLLFSSIFMVSALYAEDTEVLSSEPPPSEPNILFILDQSGSMNTWIPSLNISRATALKNAFNTVVTDPELKDVNVGLMGFSYQSNISRVDAGDWSTDAGLYRYVAPSSWPYPHGVAVPVSPIDDLIKPIMMSNLLPQSFNDGETAGFFTLDNDSLINPSDDQTVRQYLPAVLDSWGAMEMTPIVESLYEAALYFRGAPPKMGSAPPDESHSAHPSTYSGEIYTTTKKEVTGERIICADESCGINCLPTIAGSSCAVGETSCGLGTNCSTVTQEWTYVCDLSSEAACLASNPSYSRCDLVSYEDCTTSCSGDRDPENGACLGEETTSCNTNSYYNCVIPTDVTSCDHDRYVCEITSETSTVVNNATYNSPIKNECQSHAIILLSDGQPHINDDWGLIGAQNGIKEIVGKAESDDCDAVEGEVIPATNINSLAHGRCGTELTSYLANNDQSEDVAKSSVKTYTVGFGVDADGYPEKYLRSLANSGGGKYFPASDTSGLVTAFKSIIEDIGSTARSYAAPVYTVDKSSLLAHSRDIYLPLFENSDLPMWPGNLKKFKLNDAGDIVDKNGDVAIDANGALRETAVDFWASTGSVTGGEPNSVTSGGAASQINPSSRKLLTDDGVSNIVPLNSTNASKGLLGDASMSDEDQTKLLNFIKGLESDGVTARKHMGDILHSKPVVVTYANEQVVFFGTNEGYLHAVNAADAPDDTSNTTPGEKGGTEKFAFMPSPLLKNINGQFENTELTGDLKRIYGVDGSMSLLINDENHNGKVDGADTAYLYFGLRRGGSHMYALNITDPDDPKLMWKISNGDVGFSQLGETWSKPVVAKLRYKPGGTAAAVTNDVLVFGGGYDNRLDKATLSERSDLSSAKGNAVYIVNAKTKDLIWSWSSANDSDFKHSVPGGIRALDIDRNGSIDRLYFGDTGGNIWRADLNVDDFDDDESLNDVKKDAQVVKFASLGGSGDPRKFFYEPDVSFFKYNGKYTLLVSIGSGYRVYPLNKEITDRFYVLSDENVLNIPETTRVAITESDLVSASGSELGGGSFLPNHKGWYKTLATGEKVLSSPLIFMNKVMFTTFTPDSAAAEDSCSVASNKAQAYVLDITTTLAVDDLDGDGVPDERIDLPPTDPIPTTPQIFIPPPSNCTKRGCDQPVVVRVGKKAIVGGIDIGELLPKVYWLDNKK